MTQYGEAADRYIARLEQRCRVLNRRLAAVEAEMQACEIALDALWRIAEKQTASCG